MKMKYIVLLVIGLVCLKFGLNMLNEKNQSFEMTYRNNQDNFYYYDFETIHYNVIGITVGKETPGTIALNNNKDNLLNYFYTKETGEIYIFLEETDVSIGLDSNTNRTIDTSRPAKKVYESINDCTFIPECTKINSYTYRIMQIINNKTNDIKYVYLEGCVFDE